MNIFRKNLKLVIFLGVFCIILLFLNLLLSSKSEPSQSLPIATPTPTTLPEITLIPAATTDPKVEEFYKKLDEETYRDFPLFDHTPYQTDNWKITYVKSLQLVVTLKKDTPDIRQEVLDWIVSKGVDPKTHKIIWKTP